jgi:hypothetical protein
MKHPNPSLWGVAKKKHKSRREKVLEGKMNLNSCTSYIVSSR